MENNATNQSATVRPAKTGPMWQENADYYGALVLHGSDRFAVSPNGKRYLWQHSSRVGDVRRFGVKNWRKKLSLLLPDLPDNVADFVKDRFPENSIDFERPWASLISDSSARVLATRYDHESYSGVIAVQGDLRLIFIGSPDRFCLQERLSASRWGHVFTSKNSAYLSDLVCGRLDREHKARAFNGVRVFVEAVAALPSLASDYSGSRPEFFKDAFHAPSRVLSRPLPAPVRLPYSPPSRAAPLEFVQLRAISREDRHAACKARRDAADLRRSVR